MTKKVSYKKYQNSNNLEKIFWDSKEDKWKLQETEEVVTPIPIGHPEIIHLPRESKEGLIQKELDEANTGSRYTFHSLYEINAYSVGPHGCGTVGEGDWKVIGNYAAINFYKI